MNLKRASEVAEVCRKWEKSETWHNTPEMQATIILDNRVTKLEDILKANKENHKVEIKELKYTLSRARYMHKNRLIKQIQDKTIEAAIEAVQNRPMKDCMFVRGDAITAIKSVRKQEEPHEM